CFRLGPAGLLAFGFADLRLASVWAKGGNVGSVPLCPTSPVPMSEHFGVWGLYYVAADGHIPAVRLYAVGLLLPCSRGREEDATSLSGICRVHAPHGHVPAGKSRRSFIQALVWRRTQSAVRTSTCDWKFRPAAAYRRHWTARLHTEPSLPLWRHGKH